MKKTIGRKVTVLLEAEYRGFKFSDKDVVNIDNYEPPGRYGSHQSNRAWLIHDECHVICIVFASNEQDALDEAADADKLDFLMIDPKDKYDLDDYFTDDFAKADGGLDKDVAEYMSPDGKRYWWRVGRMPSFLGNAGEPFDTDNLGILKMPNPPISFCAIFIAHQQERSP
jgi:hypothetical protein